MKGLALAALLVVTAAARADTVHLRNGGLLKGAVLKKQADKVFVDLGFTVLSVPADEIDRIAPDGEKPASGDDDMDLYRTASGQDELTVKENVDRVGEAVVEIRTSTGLGSGFLVHPDGYVITNDHVVAGEHRIAVTLFKRSGKDLEKVQFRKVRIVATNAKVDLALLKIEDDARPAFPTVPLGDSDRIQQGQAVFAVGSPLGLERTVSQGIVSLRNRPSDGRLYIQTTAQINPGNSGGPLFNLRGEVVGVNNMKLVMTGIEGMGFAIPSAALKSFLRNRDAFAFDPRNPNAGFRYLSPPKPENPSPPQGDRK